MRTDHVQTRRRTMQVQFWERMRLPVPYVAMEIQAQREKYRVLMNKVLAVVRRYNHILSSVTGHRKLFTDRLRAIDRRVSSGLNKLTWNMDRGALDFYQKEARRCAAREQCCCCCCCCCCCYCSRRRGRHVADGCVIAQVLPRRHAERGGVQEGTCRHQGALRQGRRHVAHQPAAQEGVVVVFLYRMRRVQFNDALRPETASCWRFMADQSTQASTEARSHTRERVQVMEYTAFADAQRQHHAAASAMLEDASAAVTAAKDSMYEVFAADGAEVHQQWFLFTERLDSDMLAAMRVAVKKSLAELSKAINGDKGKEVAPLFCTALELEKTLGSNETVELKPTLQDLANLIRSVSRDLLQVCTACGHLLQAQSLWFSCCHLLCGQLRASRHVMVRTGACRCPSRCRGSWRTSRTACRRTARSR